MFRGCLFVPCGLVNACWERADLLTLLRVMLSCVFVTFPYGVLSQVSHLIVSISDICLLLPFIGKSINGFRKWYCSIN